MFRRFTTLGAINLFVSVALGAFGAHGLKGQIEDAMLANWQTGVHYHMVHGLAILFLAVAADKVQKQKQLQLAGWLFFAGIVFFSGSLYVMALTGVKVLGAITPIGGVCFLTAWVLTVLAAASAKK